MGPLGGLVGDPGASFSKYPRGGTIPKGGFDTQPYGAATKCTKLPSDVWLPKPGYNFPLKTDDGEALEFYGATMLDYALRAVDQHRAP